MSKRSYLLALLGIIAVVLLGSGLDVMEVDAAQYAGMARDMSVHGDVLQLFYRGEDYLDKPPLLFWLSALSFTVFGVHEFAYRLPSDLFAFLGLFSLYRFALLYHGKEVAKSATLVFGCSVAFFLMNNDVRCDTILTGSVITAVWLGCTWLDRGGLKWAVAFAVAIAMGMLVKGPIGLVAPMLAVGSQLLFTQKWHRFKDPSLIAILVVIAILLVPMCIGLYEQHGMHGIRFYFWEQSFGRITGENRWKDDSTVFFFTHELIWQLLPWTLVVLVGLWRNVRALILGRSLPEYASTIGGILVFVALSFSQFKLPHYLYVALPLFAVVAAMHLHHLPRIVRIGNGVVIALLLIAGIILTWFAFPGSRLPFIGLLVAASVGVSAIFRSKGILSGFVPAASLTAITLGIVLNGYLYPNVLQYQANAVAGKWAAEHALSSEEFFGMQVNGGALDFYAGYPVRWISNAEEAEVVTRPGIVIYTDEVHRKELIQAGLVPVKEIVLRNYPAQRLSLAFLLSTERDLVIEQRYLMIF